MKGQYPKLKLCLWSLDLSIPAKQCRLTVRCHIQNQSVSCPPGRCCRRRHSLACRSFGILSQRHRNLPLPAILRKSAVVVIFRQFEPYTRPRVRAACTAKTGSACHPTPAPTLASCGSDACPRLCFPYPPAATADHTTQALQL